MFQRLKLGKNLNLLTTRIAMEILSHEAIVREAYRDSVDVWTWGVGITEYSGHRILPRYQDNPQTLRWCLEVFLRVLHENYIPAVNACFDGYPLSECQFGAALSFQYNTGGLSKADWVQEWKDGEIEAARISIMNWRKPAQIIGRRTCECALFFDGVWSNDGTVKEYSVSKPTYYPDPDSKRPIAVQTVLEDLLANR